MSPSTPAPLRAGPRIAAWSAVLISTVPDIFWRGPGMPSPLWQIVMESCLILALAFGALCIPSWRPVARFLFAIALLNLTWDYLSPTLAGLNSVRAVTDHVSWGERLFLSRLFTLLGVVLVVPTLIGSGITRRDLFLCVGNPGAPAQPIPFLGLRKSVRWTVLGPVFIVIFALALAPYLYLTVDPNFRLSDRIIRTIPWSVAVAVLNAASEEFQFRSVLLAHLRGVFGSGENILLTAAFFGIGHYHGQPSGFLGALMAGTAGWIWARSMIDTRGGLWAFLIHMIQDMVIFSFLAVGAGM